MAIAGYAPEMAVDRTQHVEREKMQGPSLSDAVSQRVTSIDALRGFDMLWIIGGEGILRSLHPIFHHPTTAWISTQLTHVRWEGFHFYDLIFPIIKLIWTSSYVLVACGWSLL
jgi:predicted acyltransferase